MSDVEHEAVPAVDANIETEAVVESTGNQEVAIESTNEVAAVSNDPQVNITLEENKKQSDESEVNLEQEPQAVAAAANMGEPPKENASVPSTKPENDSVKTKTKKNEIVPRYMRSKSSNSSTADTNKISTQNSNKFVHSTVYGTHKGEMTTGRHVNSRFMTTAEENERLRRQNNVKPTYRGPVYVTEEVSVLCSACYTPVDPVTRVPVGTLFFHPFCVSCCLCGKTGVAEPFFQYGFSVICSDCVTKGHTPFINVEEADRRNMVLGAMNDDPQKIFHAQDEQRRLLHQSKRMDHSRYVGKNATVNQTNADEATPPTLSITANLHDTRNTTSRSFALMQRQQYYTQNDHNVPTMMPPNTNTDNSTKNKKSNERAQLENVSSAGDTCGNPLPIEDQGAE